MPSAAAFAPSAALAGVCTLDGQKEFLRSYLDEVYLWSDEIAPVDAASFGTLSGYFNALLVRTPDVTGRPKDHFSALQTIAVTASQQIAALAAPAASPVQRASSPGDQVAPVASSSVPLSQVVSTAAGRKVGYVLFKDHHQGAQDALIAAFEGLRSAGVQDLVLDMRANPGGYLYVAQTAASMVTGPASSGRLFEHLRYNAKTAGNPAADDFLFSDQVQTAETTYPAGYSLPQLGLPRVYVLTSGTTCSASESVINSLRGIDVEVITVGGTTCGKPYGFKRRDNCGVALYPIQFQGYNAKNFGGYLAGFEPTCPVADNFSGTPGSADEPLLATALHHIDTGSCGSSVAARALRAGETDARAQSLAPNDGWDGRLLRPGQ